MATISHPNEARCRKKTETKIRAYQSITDCLPAELEGFEHRQKEEFSRFSCPKIAGGGHNFSKLSEIKGYEVFRADTPSSVFVTSHFLA